MGTLGQEGQDQQGDRKGPRKRRRELIDPVEEGTILSKREHRSTVPRKKRKTRPALGVVDADFHLPMIQRA